MLDIDIHIHIIITGGTIDKIYSPVTEKPELVAASHVPEFITDVVKVDQNISFETLFLKDSLDMTEDDRNLIFQSAIKSKAHKILITHGTSTMQDTAVFLKQHQTQLNGKTVILTGAMIPMKEFAYSDGGFNLGYALAAVKYHAPGVYVCMNGQSFEAGCVTKDVQATRFKRA